MADYKDDLHADSQHELGTLVDALSLSTETRRQAQAYITDVIERDDISLMGRGINVVVPAAVLLASRQTGDVRTANEIAATADADITTHRIHNTAKFLASELELGIIIADPRDYIDRIQTQLDATQTETTIAKNIITELQRNDCCVNKRPSTIAAAVFYYVSVYADPANPYTQQEVSDAADVSTQTIRQNYESVPESLPDTVLTEFPLRHYNN